MKLYTTAVRSDVECDDTLKTFVKMDISAFSDENFDVREWINKTFRSVDSLQNKEALVSSMVSKLQLYVQQVNGALEETSQQVLQNLPRVMHDAEMIHREALMLKDKMKVVKEEIAKIERDTGESIVVIEKLDKLKSELQSAKQSLHEADNWTVLASDIEDVFETHDIDAIASKVVSMQQSLIVLASTVDFEDRRLQLEGFKNRLEAIASPHLVKAFTSNNTSDSKKFVSIFSSMDRLSELIKYYSKCQKGLLCQQWRSLVDVEQDNTVAEWLSSFYEILLLNWQSQVKWCQEVFDSWEMLPNIYTEALASMDPSLSSCIETALKQQVDPLPFLVQMKKSTKNFAMNLEAVLNHQGGVKKETWWRLCQALYLPYMKYVSNYRELEEKHCSQELLEVTVGKKDDLDDFINSLGQSFHKVLSICRSAETRCVEFTSSTAFPALIQTVEFCLLKFLDQYKVALKQMDVERQHKDEWTMFRVSLTLLQNVGELLLEVEDLDRELVQNFLKSAREEEKVDMKRLLLDKQAQAQYNKLIEAVLEEPDTSVLATTAVKSLSDVCHRAYRIMFDTMFTPISSQLEGVNKFVNQHGNPQQMPDYSYAPLEYITQIGEYMMTLPQHLEPFVLRENPGLSRSLVAALKSTDHTENPTPAYLLLGAVANHTCTAYTDIILNIHELSPHASKQLSVDIGYLGDVLDDFGFSLSENLQILRNLLKAPPENFHSLSIGSPPKLVAAVRHMRNITAL